MTPTEKAAYIKGMLEGMKFNTESDEGKLFVKIIDLLEDLSISVSDLEDETERLGGCIDEIDEDLANVEDIVYDDDDCCDCCDCDDDCDCCDCDDDYDEEETEEDK